MSYVLNGKINEISKLKDLRKHNKVSSYNFNSEKFNEVIEEWSTLRESIGRNSQITSPLSAKLKKKQSFIFEPCSPKAESKSMIFKGVISPLNVNSSVIRNDQHIRRLATHHRLEANSAKIIKPASFDFERMFGKKIQERPKIETKLSNLRKK